MLIKVCVHVNPLVVSDAAGWLHSFALCKLGHIITKLCIYAELGSKSGPSWTPHCQIFSHHINSKPALLTNPRHSHTILTLPLPHFLTTMRLSRQHLRGTQQSDCSGQF